MEEELCKAYKTIQELNITTRRLNIRVIGVPEGMEGEARLLGILNEIIKENFPHTGKE